jgi:short-subunit dehydrogenase
MKRVLVIGSSGAFGKLFCDKLAQAGYQVLGTARNTEAFPASVELSLRLDLEDQSSIDTLANYLISENLELNGIIQAAGAVGFGKIEETSAENANRLMQINHLGPASLITKLSPLMTEESFVIGITGVVSEKVFPGMSAYTSSKMAFAAFLSNSHLEWRRRKIQVLDAKPGHTETGLASRAIFGTAPAFPQGMTSDHVVSTILAGLAEGKNLLASTDF